MKKIRLLVAEDHGIVRQGLIDILTNTEDIMVVAEADNGRSMVDKYFEFKPDIVLSDIEMPHMKGIEAATEILRKHKKAKIIFLTMHNTDEYIYWAKINNIAGLLSKSVLKAELVDAIRLVNSGEKYFMNKTENDINKIVAKYDIEADKGQIANPTKLTEREKDIVIHIADGRTSEQISKIVGLSKKTIDSERAHLMRKLNITTFAQMMKYAVEYVLELKRGDQS